MKLVIAALLVFGITSQVYSQTDPQAPRKAPDQFVSTYSKAKKVNQQIQDMQTKATDSLEKKVKPKRINLKGLVSELNDEQQKFCSDLKQGCRYDENLKAFLPNPIPQQTPASGQSGTVSPDKSALTEKPTEEKK